MKAKDMYAWESWEFDAELTDDSFIKCPKCDNRSPISEWIETEVLCETCGTHNAIECPKCNSCFDHVWSPVFYVVK